jgi:RNA polymerase sigma factor for flagellar operon FliA
MEDDANEPAPQTGADRAEGEAAFLAALPQIEQAIRWVGRRNHLSGPEAEDFASEVKLAFIEGGYAVLSRYEGRSSLRTYLVTVVQRLFIDRRRREWGKWRPSAEARRLGAVALQLEALLHRDRLSLPEALQALRTNFGVEEAEHVLTAMAQRLPARERRIQEPLDEPGRPEAFTARAEDPQGLLQSTETASRCQAALEGVVGALAPEDRLVLRMRFEDGLSVADVARILHLDQKKLYRRLEGILATLRRSLEAGGLAWSDVEALIERGQCHLRLPLVARRENSDPRPSPDQAMP